MYVNIDILAEASERFRPLCTKLKVVQLDVYCNAKTDPIRPLIDAATSACSNSSALLQQFSSQFAGTVNGDLRHLFHARDFNGKTVGCAFTRGLCSSNGSFRTGINEITFSDWADSKANLVAHEVGHGVGCAHSLSKSGIMFGSVTRDRDEFMEECSRMIRTQMSTTECISEERAILLDEDNFETGGSLVGALLIDRIQSEMAYEGAYSLALGRLHDGSSSNIAKINNTYSLPTGTHFRLSFYFLGRGMMDDGNDNFQVQAMNYRASRSGITDGTENTWRLVRRFDFGDKNYFSSNEVWYKAVVESQSFMETTHGIEFRLVVFGGSENNYTIFFDNLKIEQIDLI